MYNPNYIEWNRQGWVCPKCGHVYSPETSQCYNCNKEQRTFTSTNTNVNEVEITPSGAYIYHGTRPEVYYDN